MVSYTQNTTTPQPKDNQAAHTPTANPEAIATPRHRPTPIPRPTPLKLLEQRHMRGAGRKRPRITPNPTKGAPPQHYIEQQHRQHCLVHAYNAMQGEQRLSAETLRDHARQRMSADIQYMIHNHLETHHLTSENGDFNVHLLHHYLHTSTSTPLGTQPSTYTRLVCRRLSDSTPHETLIHTLQQHDHRAMLLVASPLTGQGHYVAVRRHRNGLYYIYDSLNPETVLPLTPKYIADLEPTARNTVVLILASAAHHPAEAVPALFAADLKDYRESTCPTDIDTLKDRHHEKQQKAHCLVHAVNNALGRPITSFTQLQDTRNNAQQQRHLRRQVSAPHADGWFNASDFNAWSDDRLGTNIRLHAIGEYQPGQNFQDSLANLCNKYVTDSNDTWADHPHLTPTFLIMHCGLGPQEVSHFVAIIRAGGRWYAIDSQEWDTRRDLPICLPMDNTCNASMYTGIIYLFINTNSHREQHRNPETCVRLPTSTDITLRLRDAESRNEAGTSDNTQSDAHTAAHQTGPRPPSAIPHTLNSHSEPPRPSPRAPTPPQPCAHPATSPPPHSLTQTTGSLHSKYVSLLSPPVSGNVSPKFTHFQHLTRLRDTINPPPPQPHDTPHDNPEAPSADPSTDAHTVAHDGRPWGSREAGMTHTNATQQARPAATGPTSQGTSKKYHRYNTRHARKQPQPPPSTPSDAVTTTRHEHAQHLGPASGLTTQAPLQDTCPKKPPNKRQSISLRPRAKIQKPGPRPLWPKFAPVDMSRKTQSRLTQTWLHPAQSGQHVDTPLTTPTNQLPPTADNTNPNESDEPTQPPSQDAPLDTATQDDLDIMTLNVRGALSYPRGITETMDMLHQYPADIIALTETKLHDAQSHSSPLRKATQNYARFHSCATLTAKEDAKRGVTLLIKQDLLHDFRNHNTESAKHVPPGTVAHVSLHIRHHKCSTDILAIYIPPEDRAARTAIYRYIESVCQNAATQGIKDTSHRRHVIIMGDFNATTADNKRSTTDEWGNEHPRDSTSTLSDKDHRAHLERIKEHLPNLRLALGDTEANTTTYQQHVRNLVHHSQIDDILTWSSGTTQTRLPTARAVEVTTLGTDHKAVILATPQTHIHIPRKRQPPNSTRTKLKWDQAMMKDKHTLDDIRMKIELDTLEHTQRADRILSAPPPEDQQSAHNTIDNLSDLLLNAMDTALGVCKDTIAKEVTCHAHPHNTREEKKTLQKWRQGKHIIRTLANPNEQRDQSKTQEALNTLSKLLKHGAQDSFERTQQEPDSDDELEETENLQGAPQQPPHTGAAGMNQSLEDVQHAASKIIRRYRPRQPKQTPDQTDQDTQAADDSSPLAKALEALALLQRAQSRKLKTNSFKQYRKFINTLRRQNPKRAHKIIYKKGTTHQLESVKLSNGLISYDPTDIAKSATNYFTKEWSHPSGAPAGTPPPWTTASTDPILESISLSPAESTQFNPTRPPPVSSLRDYANREDVFAHTIAHLAKNKANGPDAIPNELLRILPEQLKSIIFRLFQLMWRHAYTPPRWKTSNTVLIYKKNDPDNLKNYRPVGLCNTLYKLWTAHINNVLTTYLEEYDLLHNAQEGFRRDRNTKRQIMQLQLLFANAKRNKQPIVAQFVDFSCAFNTISHAQMMTVMEMVGIPEDARAVVRHLYTGANTKIVNKTPAFESDYIDIQQGVIQGDTLSPTIFVIMMDPLLRWLQAGNHGFDTKIRNPDTKDILDVPTIAYADDLTLLCKSVSGLRIQNAKLGAFSHWAGLRINAGKCECTMVDWRIDAPLSQRSREQYECQLANRNRVLHHAPVTVTVEGTDQTIPFTDPTKAIKYLGAYITPSLDATEQIDTINIQLQEASAHLRRSGLTPSAQADTFRATCLQKIIYPFALANITLKQSQDVDKAIRKFAKQSFRIPLSTPSDVLHLPVDQLGKGVPQFLPSVAATVINEWRRAAADTGSLGALLRSQLEWEQTITRGLLPNMKTWDAFQQLPCSRVLGLMRVAGIKFPEQEAIDAHLPDTHADWLTRLCNAADDAALQYPHNLIAQSVLTCQKAKRLDSFLSEQNGTLHVTALRNLSKCEMKTTTDASAVATARTHLHAMLNGTTYRPRTQQTPESDKPPKEDSPTQAARTPSSPTPPDSQALQRMRQIWCNRPTSNNCLTLPFQIAPRPTRPPQPTLTEGGAHHAQAPADTTTLTASQHTVQPPDSEAQTRKHKTKRQRIAEANIQRIERTQRCPTNHNANLRALPLSTVNEELRARHRTPDYTPLDNTQWAPLTYTKEQFDTATSHIQRIDHLFDQDNTRHAKQYDIRNPKTGLKLKLQHLAGVHAYVHWKPALVTDSLVEALKAHDKTNGYKLQQQRRVEYPRDAEEQRERDALLEQALITPTTTFYELTYEPSCEPLLNLLPQPDESDDDSPLSQSGETSDDSEDSGDERVENTDDEHSEQEQDDNSQTKIQPADMYDHLYAWMATKYLDNICTTTTTIGRPRHPPLLRPHPTQMAFHSHSRTDWTLSRRNSEGSLLYTLLHFPADSTHPTRDTAPRPGSHGMTAHHHPHNGSLTSLHLPSGNYLCDLPRQWADNYTRAMHRTQPGTALSSSLAATAKSLSAHALTYQHNTRSSMPAAIPSLLLSTLLSHFKLNTVINSAPFLQHDDTTHHYTVKEADKPFGLCQDTWQHAWRDCLVLCPPETDATRKYIRWTLCSMQHATEGAEPTVALIITAKGKAEQQCEALIEHGSVIRIGELKPLHRHEDLRATQPRNCTLWIVPSHPQDTETQQRILSFIASISLPDMTARMAADDTIPFHMTDVSTEESVLNATRRYRRSLHPPTNLQRILDTRKHHRPLTDPPSPPTPNAIETPGRIPDMHVHPPIPDTHTRLHMALTGTGTYSATGPHRCFFTDGSKRSTQANNTTTEVTGSGAVECTLTEHTLQYRAMQAQPSTPGAHHDIFRAELVAILLTLQWADNCLPPHAHPTDIEPSAPSHPPAPKNNIVVFIDSKAAINAINAHLHSKKHTHDKLHSALLDAISLHLLARAEANKHTHLCKVKSHVGIEGNEIADKVASAAADNSLTHAIPPNTTIIAPTMDLSSYRTELPAWWPLISSSPPQAPRPTTTNDATVWTPANNAPKMLRQITQQRLVSDQHTVYGKGLQDDARACVAKTNNLAWEIGTDAQQRTAILTRTGKLYNKKLEYIYSGRTDAAQAPCPLCGQPDSVSHIVTAACRHKDMKAIAIKRHNLAVSIIAKALLKTPIANNCTLILDLGEQQRQLMPTRAIGNEVISSRIPQRILYPLLHTLHQDIKEDHPHTMHLISQQCGNSINTTELRAEILQADNDEHAVRILAKKIHLRPDIMLETTQAHPDISAEQHKTHRFIIVEVGYCREGFGKAKMEEKARQHALLRYLIEKTHPGLMSLAYATATLGVTGAIYNDVARCLATLGINPSRTRKTYRQLVHTALNMTHAMVVKRRTLEHHGAPYIRNQQRTHKRKKPPDK